MVANARAEIPLNVASHRANVTVLPRAGRALPAGDTVVAGPRARFSVGVACVTFLWIYGGLHLAHAWGVEPPFVRAVAPIPLFAIFIIGLATSAFVSFPVAYLLIGKRRAPASLSRALALSIVAFSLAVTWVP
jgi:hypothetical protein